VINLALADDSALGGVVAALGGLGSHIVGLRKSEPTLEDVFVELVGRGFEEAARSDGSAAPPGSSPRPAADRAADPGPDLAEPADEVDVEAREEVGSR